MATIKHGVIYEYDKIAADNDKRGQRADGVFYVSETQFGLLENFILSNKSDGENSVEVMRLQLRRTSLKVIPSGRVLFCGTGLAKYLLYPWAI